MSEAIVVAVITGGLSLVGTLLGTYFSQKKSTALITYRINQLEKKVQAHNNLIERTYKLEETASVHEEKIRVANHRIEDLEKKVGA